MKLALLSLFYWWIEWDSMQLNKWESWVIFLKKTSKSSMGIMLVSQMVKNLPAMWETWVQALGQEGALEDSMATHSSIFA